MIRLALALTLLLQFLLPPSALAETYRSLYDQALMASQAGDFARALPLWDQLLDLGRDQSREIRRDQSREIGQDAQRLDLDRAQNREMQVLDLDDARTDGEASRARRVQYLRVPVE